MLGLSGEKPSKKLEAYTEDAPGLQVMQPALTTLANCVTVPPSMTHLVCPAEKPSSRKRQGRAAGQTPGQLPTPGQPHTPGQAPDTSGKVAAELLQAGSMEVTHADRYHHMHWFTDAVC